jgi:uncharacterized protein (DUF433 family)
MNLITPKTWKYLERDPMSRLKQLSIRGRRIRARTLFGRFMSAEEPMTPEEIAADYSLPLEAVLEAIAYCQSDPPEIKEDFEREERFMEAIGLKEPGGKYRRLSPEERAQLGL